jgi:hypothetical protein
MSYESLALALDMAFELFARRGLMLHTAETSPSHLPLFKSNNLLATNWKQ